jgi:hypothetical protein
MPTKKPIDHTEHRPGKDPSKMIDRLYSEGRTYPREQLAKWADRDAANYDAKDQGEAVQAHNPHPYHRHEEIRSPQHRENQHDVNYDNDARGWVRGAPNGQMPTGHNEDATRLGNFDRGNAYRTDRDSGMADQIKDRAGDHNRHHTEFELRHNAGMTHAFEAHDYFKRHVPQYDRRGELGLYRPDSHSKPRRQGGK